MRIGQIVFIEDSLWCKAQTGIIAKKELDKNTDQWWYEVLCNDGENHVIPEFLLSPGKITKDHVIFKYKNKLQK
tara:strand:- start:1832 stop:2053 length:222 start_codon:yes stop_codon:yes gene_type:complete